MRQRAVLHAIGAGTAAVLGLLILGGPGCGMTLARKGEQTIPLVGNPNLPAAQGQIAARVNDAGNTEFKVTAEHLAPPDKAVAGARLYVVWLRPEGQPPQNVGVLDMDRKNRSATFSGVTPYRRFDLEITAERERTARFPSQHQVLSAKVYQIYPQG